MSSQLDLSPQQQQVVESEEQRIAIVAAAGSGKTRVLVERYLRHVLREKINPDRILTITFTRKAAAEMKQRIVRGLRDFGAFDEAQIAETGPIQTIHSLCEQLLRENAVQAGLDSKFEILSESQSQRMQIGAVEEATSEMGYDREDAESLIRQLAGKRKYGGGDSPYGLLRESIAMALDHFRGAGLFLGDVENCYQSRGVFNEIWKSRLLSATPPGVAERFVSDTEIEWPIRLKMAYKGSPHPVPGWIRQPSTADEDAEVDTSTCGIGQLAAEAWQLLDARMYEKQAFDFTALEERAVQLLEKSEEVRQRVARKYEIVMVDEAQDLNPKQHRLLNLLGTNRLLTVGDGQQSIYGFRHADMELFMESHAGGAQRLSKNWRAQRGLLLFIDKLFADTWKDRYCPMVEQTPFDLDDAPTQEYEGIEFWELPNDVRLNSGYIGRLIDAGEKPGDICVLTRSTATCQHIHEALSRAGIPSQISGGSEKFYTRMEVRDVANILRSLADPYDDFALLAVLRGPSVGLSMESFVLMGREKPVLEAFDRLELSSEDAQRLADFRAWFDPLRAYADRLSAWEVLCEVFASSSLLAALSSSPDGGQQVANVRKLLVLAGQDSHLGPREFAEQIREIQQLRHKEGDAEQARDQSKLIRLMTIHKAKGLEFPVVVLPDTNVKLGKAPPEVIYDPKLRLLSANFARSSHAILPRFLAERKKERELDEELRVLYVAMTRAQRKLCISLYPPAAGDTLGKRIRRSFGDPPPASIHVRRPLELA